MNARSYSGVTALHHAAYCNFLDVAKVLIKYKADTTIRDQYGNTPMEYADQYEYTRMIALLSSEKKEYTIKTQFDLQEWRYCEGTGSCELIGHAFIRVKGTDS